MEVQPGGADVVSETGVAVTCDGVLVTIHRPPKHRAGVLRRGVSVRIARIPFLVFSTPEEPSVVNADALQFICEVVNGLPQAGVEANHRVRGSARRGKRSIFIEWP